jgi:hypothetical protein
MTTNRIVLALALFVTIAAVGGAAVALAGKNQSDLAAAKQATAGFRSVGSAETAGYAELRDAKKIACIDLPGSGGMGIHYVDGDLVKDAVLDPRRPEALVYAPSGKALRLAALEYIVFAKAWKQSTPPALFGRTFDYVAAGNRYGLPAFWALHAWVWDPNPSGTVMAWNPRVTCH